MISFFEPTFLWALAALALPVVIHLFFRRKTVRLDFSSLRFLRASALHASRRRRLQELLLLLTRLAIVAVVVLLAARPFSSRDPFRTLADPHVAVYCWSDPTVSMEYRVRQEPLWRHSLGLIAGLDSALAATAELLVWDGGRGEFVAWGERGAAQAVAVRHGPSDLAAMAAAFGARLHAEKRQAVLMLFSDFQTRDSALVDSLIQRIDSTMAPLLCVAMGEKKPWNYSIGASRLAATATAAVQCSLRTTGRALPPAPLEVLVDAMRTGSRSVQLAGNDSAGLVVDVSIPPQAGSGMVRLAALDPFALDNQDYFAVDRPATLRILLVAAGEESFPLAVALSALPQRPALVVKSAPQVELDDIDSSDVIVLSAIREPTPPLLALLRGGAASGKLLLFAPVTEPHAGSFNNLVFSHLGLRGPAMLAQPDRPRHVVLPDTLSPLWRSFPRLEDRSVEVSGYFKAIPGTAICLLSDRAPLATRVLDKQGRAWIVFSTALGIDRANNLCETGFFLPLLDRSIHYGLSAVHRGGGDWIAGEARRNPYFGSRRWARVSQADGRFHSQWESQASVRFETPGVYTVQPVGEPAYHLAVHLDPREAVIDYRPPQVPEKSDRWVRVVPRDSFGRFLDEHLRHSSAALLWIGLALLLIAETVLRMTKKSTAIERIRQG